jgi:HlyD family type I secretion membrane fusion protein
VLRVGYLLVLLTFGGFGGASAVARIDAGVIANGIISVESNRKTIQHLEGGIVAEILVRDGTVVAVDDVLLRLDPTRTAASEGLYRRQLLIARALEARLLAQRDVLEQVTFPPEVLELATDPLVAAALNDNRRQFEARRQVFVSGLAVLERQIAQARSDIQQATSDRDTARQQLKTIETELPGLKDLLSRGLVTLPRVTTLEREQQRLEGVLGKSTNDTVRAQERISELEVRGRQLRQEYVQDAAVALAEIRKTLNDLSQQTIVAEDALRRVDIRAPVAGTVQSLRAFTIGGVIRAGDPILEIVPTSDTLVVRAKVSPLDVDRVRTAKNAQVRLPQFTRYQSHTIQGVVRNVSRDVVIDPQNREPYFDIEVIVDRSTVSSEIRGRLSPGMTADVIVPTAERTILEYLVSPILNPLAFALRER